MSLFRFFRTTRPARAATNEPDPLLRQRIVRLHGPIEDANANDLIARLLYLQETSDKEPIHLCIDSPGGSVSAGLAIIDTIDLLKPRVHTHCEQMAAGMALVILVSGHRGERSARETSTLIFTLAEASEAASATAKAQVERFTSILAEKTARATGISEAYVHRLFHGLPPVNGREAKQMGLVDKLD